MRSAPVQLDPDVVGVSQVQSFADAVVGSTLDDRGLYESSPLCIWVFAVQVLET
jgi:hypothetical protein